MHTEFDAELPSKWSCFDIGGGNGTVSLAIQEGGFDVCLLEPEIAGVRDAMQKGIGTVICSTFDAADFSKGGLPAVGLFDVLEHIKDDGEFLTKIRDALEPRGKVFLTVPAFEFLWSEADDNSGHYRRYTSKRLSTLFDKIGFKVLYVSCFFTVLIPPIFLLRSIPYKFSMHRSDPDWRHQHHQDKRGISGSLLLRCMRWEQFMIKHQKAMPFGSSCILVAEKCDVTDL